MIFGTQTNPRCVFSNDVDVLGCRRSGLSCGMKMLFSIFGKTVAFEFGLRFALEIAFSRGFWAEEETISVFY